jgi:hypothetical protein
MPTTTPDSTEPTNTVVRTIVLAQLLYAIALVDGGKSVLSRDIMIGVQHPSSALFVRFVTLHAAKSLGLSLSAGR